MLIKGQSTFLELFEPADAAYVHTWMHEIELRRLAWMECPLPIDLAGAERWIREMNQDPRSRLLSVRRLEDNGPIGLMSLRNLSWVSRSVRSGIMIWPADLWNKGFGTDARRAFLEYAFKQLNLRRVYGRYAAYNQASRRSHEKLGGETTVTARDAVFVDGRFHDVHYYVYKRENYPGLEPAKSEPEPVSPPADQFGAVYRVYEDYYGLPRGEGEACDLWRRDKISRPMPDGEYVFSLHEIPQSADLLLLPANGDRCEPGLLDEAIATGFTDLNLHRIQACLPASAVSWLETFKSRGFCDEGRLDGVVFAAGRYLDLVFLGLLSSS